MRHLGTPAFSSSVLSSMSIHVLAGKLSLSLALSLSLSWDRLRTPIRPWCTQPFGCREECYVKLPRWIAFRQDLRLGRVEGRDDHPPGARSCCSWQDQKLVSYLAGRGPFKEVGADAIFGPILAPHARTVANDFLTKNPSSEAGAHVAYGSFSRQIPLSAAGIWASPAGGIHE